MKFLLITCGRMIFIGFHSFYQEKSSRQVSFSEKGIGFYKRAFRKYHLSNVWACSKVVLRSIRIAESRVRFSPGPQYILQSLEYDCPFSIFCMDMRILHWYNVMHA